MTQFIQPFAVHYDRDYFQSAQYLPVKAACITLHYNVVQEKSREALCIMTEYMRGKNSDMDLVRMRLLPELVWLPADINYDVGTRNTAKEHNQLSS
jgi:hypothetical protein